MKNIFKKIDLVGFTPKLYFQKENKYKTGVGGIFTLILSLLTILAAFSFGEDIYKRTNPTILLNKKFIEPSYNMTQENIIGYRLFYTGGIRIDDIEKLVDIFLLHSQFDPKLSKAVLKRYEIIKCTQADIYKNNYLNLTSLIGNPDDYYCLPNNTTIFLKGKYGAPVNNHMHLRVGICKNTTENNNRCYPDEIIRKKMSSFFVSFIYRDSYIDGKDYDDPVKYYITSNTLKSSAYTFRQDSYLFKDVSFITDSGIILNDEHVQDYSQLDMISSGSTAESNTETFTNVIVGLNNLKDLYNRKYIKIQDISAQVGGIIKFFLIFADFFLSFYSYIPFLETLYSNLYEYNKVFLLSSSDKNNFKNNENTLGNLIIQNIIKIPFGKYSDLGSKDFHSKPRIISEKLKEKFSPSLMTPKNHTCLEVVFRKCLNKKAQKYQYLQKIIENYKTEFDVKKFLFNGQKVNDLYNFTFHKEEREILKNFSVIKFFEQNPLYVEENDNKFIISNSLIFTRLNIPRIFTEENFENKQLLIKDKNIVEC